MKKAFITAGALAMALSAGAIASEVYVYDALGRLTKVTQSDASTIDYQYDPAGNRTLVSVDGSGTPDVNPNGPSAIVVVPLNGFTVIPIN